jgi:hypothetical protein
MTTITENTVIRERLADEGRCKIFLARRGLSSLSVRNGGASLWFVLVSPTGHEMPYRTESEARAVARRNYR